jgi:hypothetical protein
VIQGIIPKDIPPASPNHLDSVLSADPAGFSYTREFTQINAPCEAQFLTGWTDGKLVSSYLDNFLLSSVSMTVTGCHANSAGFKYKSDTGARLKEYFTHHPYIVNSEKINFQPFNASTTQAGFNGISTNVSLNMCTMFMILCPRIAAQSTCFPNPHYTNFQLAVGNRRFPDKPCCTLGPEFFQLQLDQSDFDSIFPCNDAFENSITVSKIRNKKVIKPYTDCTSFVAGFSCEREGYDATYFDGMDSHNAIVNIQLFGAPIDTATDVYWDKDSIPPAPLLFTLQETIFKFTALNGGTVDYFTTYEGESMFKAQTVAALTPQ